MATWSRWGGGAVVVVGVVVVVVVVAGSVVVEPAAMVSTPRFVVVVRENGVENGSSTTVVMVAGMLTPVTTGPTDDVSGELGTGGSFGSTMNGGAVVVDCTVVDVVDTRTVVLVVAAGDEVDEVTWA